MGAGLEELRDLASTIESQKQSQRAMIRLLAEMLEVLGGGGPVTPITPVPAVITSGTNVTTVAGVKSVSFKFLTGPSVLNGRTFNALDTYSVVAPENTVLPAMLPVGGTWEWIALA